MISIYIPELVYFKFIYFISNIGGPYLYHILIAFITLYVYKAYYSKSLSLLLTKNLGFIMNSSSVQHDRQSDR